MEQTKYRLWNIINPPKSPTFAYVVEPEDALPIMHKMVYEQLADISITDNAFGLEEYDEESGEWSEWYNELGDGFNEVFDDYCERIKQ